MTDSDGNGSHIETVIPVTLDDKMKSLLPVYMMSPVKNFGRQ